LAVSIAVFEAGLMIHSIPFDWSDSLTFRPEKQMIMMDFSILWKFCSCCDDVRSFFTRISNFFLNMGLKSDVGMLTARKNSKNSKKLAH
jgi:hypothetical protein